MSIAAVNAARQPTALGKAGLAKSANAIEHQLQGIFSAVLEQAGRDGYASAEPVAADLPLETAMQSSWQSWFDSVSSTRYSFFAGSGSPSVRENKTADDLRTDYSQILSQAYREGGYVSPKSFLQKLSTEQLSAIQQVQHLADPIRVSSLSDEGALNLLLPPDTQVDMNNDGLTSVGIAQTIRFPDSQTPTEVRDAWENASAELDDIQVSIYRLMLSRFMASTDGIGGASASSASVDSYLQRASGWLDYLEMFKSRMPIEQYLRDKQFWTSFRDEIHAAQHRIAA